MIDVPVQAPGCIVASVGGGGLAGDARSPGARKALPRPTPLYTRAVCFQHSILFLINV